MPREPYDWESDDRTRRENWYRGPDNLPLSSGTFWALWNRHMQDFKALEERVDANEHRLVEQRLKWLLRDMLHAFWGKIFVIALALVIAYVVSHWWSDVPNLWTQ